MTGIGVYESDDEFEIDFPLDFGRGIRGEFVGHRKKVAGVIIVHRINGNMVCAASALWVKVNHQKLFTKAQDEPLTINEDIRCSCGLHGWIRNGVWEHAPDSLL